MSSKWQKVGLGEIADILDNQRRPVNASERLDRVGDVPYYGATGQVGWIDASLFDEELVLLGEDAIDFLNPIASKAYSISGPSWVNNHAHVLRAHTDKVMHYFLEMSLNSVDYSNFVSFGTRSKLTRGAMMQIKLQIPSLQEQRRIVNLVESIDNLIQRTDDAIIKSRIARAALLADLLNPGIDEQLREGWTKTTIADIAHVNHESISSVAGNQEIKYIDLSSVSAESGISHELWSGSLADAPGRAKRLVRTDDVLISTVRPYLRGVAKVTADLDGQVASTGFCVLRAIRNVCLPGLLWCYINQDSFFDFLMTRATGSNYPAVRPKDVSEYKLVLPPLEEQLRIAELIEAFDLEIFSLKALLINARNARTAILQDLLSGNHEIPESYDRFLEVS